MKGLGIIAAGAAVSAVPAAVLLGVVALTSQGSAAPGVPVSTPIAAPHASVKPEVAKEMNGKRGNVDIAGKIKMHSAGPVSKSLVGKGQGNGCLKNYGEPGQCLPIVSPAQQAMPDMDMPWTCADVHKLFPHGIKITGADTLGLDTNKDRTLCGPGDA